MSEANITSIVEARGLPRPSNMTSLVWINPPCPRTIPPASSVFGATDANRRDVAYMFGTSREIVPTGSYIAVLEGALISPSGLIVAGDEIIYESAYPWQIENMHTQFGGHFSIDSNKWTPKPDLSKDYDTLFYCREGGEVGYFHFITSIIPKLGLYRRHDRPPMPILINVRMPFAHQLVDLIGLKDVVEPKGWIRVKRLFFPSPFTIEGDHFTRPAFAMTLLKEVLGQNNNIKPAKTKRRVYLSRDDAAIRRLTNEKSIVKMLDEHGFEVVTTSGMPFADQIRLFSETSWLISPHGAGLANMAFMQEGAHVTEIVSPTRLWPTFRTLAARGNLSYSAVIGSAIEVAENEPALPVGNEHFRCDLWDVKMSVSQTLLTSKDF